MIRGIYTAATGMVAEMERQDVIANNLANVDTVGFKRDNAVTRQFSQILLKAFSKQEGKEIGSLGLGATTVSRYLDLSDGIMRETDNPCDLALEGTGYFTLQTSNGLRYSRAGNFSLDKEGYLINSHNCRVLGQNGPVRINGTFSVAADGTISQNGRKIDQLKIVNLDDPVQQGESLYLAAKVTPATGYRVIQGCLENSNVNVIREMIQMIATSRSYETNQKALTAMDETLGKAVNEIAR